MKTFACVMRKYSCSAVDAIDLGWPWKVLNQSVTCPDITDTKSLIKHMLWRLEAFYLAPVCSRIALLRYGHFYFEWWCFRSIHLSGSSIREHLFNLYHDPQPVALLWVGSNNWERKKKEHVGIQSPRQIKPRKQGKADSSGLLYKRSSEAARRC